MSCDTHVLESMEHPPTPVISCPLVDRHSNTKIYGVTLIHLECLSSFWGSFIFLKIKIIKLYCGIYDVFRCKIYHNCSINAGGINGITWFSVLTVCMKRYDIKSK